MSNPACTMVIVLISVPAGGIRVLGLATALILLDVGVQSVAT
jgi:hypothetical protein